MDREELIERENEALVRLTKEYIFKLEDILSRIRKTKVKLWLNKNDRMRLLTLRTWEIKHKVDLKTILEILLPFWEGFVQKRSRKTKSKGLNVRVSTLTGKKSEQILVDNLKKIFPSNENRTLWMIKEKERITFNYLKRLEKQSKRSDDGVRSRNDPSRMYAENGRAKTIEDFASPDSFMKYYRKYMKREQIVREEVEEIFKKYGYRNNPFKPELL